MGWSTCRRPPPLNLSGRTVYVTGNSSPVTATVDPSKEEDGSQVQIVNAGTNAVTFAPDGNLNIPYPVTLPGGNSSSITFVYSAVLRKYTLSTGASKIVISGGNQQTTVFDSAFLVPLQVTAIDGNNNPVAGATIVFSAPLSGASAAFSGSNTAAVVTGSNGIAVSPLPIANAQAGSYAVTASIAGTTATATFSLSNIAGSGPPGALTGVGNSSTTMGNLTSEGSADWEHWGDAALNRKSGVTPLISNYSVVGSGAVYSYNNDLRTLTWTDGTPDGIGTNNSGIYVNSLQNGFSFTVPADSTPRVLTVHVGGWLSGGTLTAHLSDGSATDFVDSTSPTGGQYDRNYTLTYNAYGPGQTLLVSWVATAGSGNVTLNGAALSLARPSIATTAGTPQSATVSNAFQTALQATVKDAYGNPLSGVTVTFTAPAIRCDCDIRRSRLRQPRRPMPAVWQLPQLSRQTRKQVPTQ